MAAAQRCVKVRAMATPKTTFLAALAVLAGACAVNPLTGKRDFVLIPESQEIEIGRQAADQAAQTIGLYDNAAVQNYVSELGKKLAAQSERPNLPWRFQVVDDPAVNAFALPGGFIFVTRGILTHLTEEAQLVAVLGHEIGHVTARHSVRQLSKAQLAQVGLAAVSVVSDTGAIGQLGAAGLGILFLKYGRDAEREADDLGFRYSLNTGYAVRSMPDVFGTLKRVGEAAGAQTLPNWLSTHPSPDERIARITGQINETNPPQGIVERDRYLAMMDGIVFGADPRHGFFDGDVFKHPAMRFQMRMPAGWKSQNLSEAVVSQGPENTGALQLTLAKEDSPGAALQKFGTMEGVSNLEPVAFPIAGTASSARFRAKTESGEIAGLVTFVAHDNKTFQLLGLSPVETFATQETTFKNTFGSFSVLTDPAALAAQPAHVQVVTVGGAMTFAQFAAPHVTPKVTVDQLAIINQVEPGTQLSPGQKMKVVKGGR